MFILHSSAFLLHILLLVLLPPIQLILVPFYRLILLLRISTAHSTQSSAIVQFTLVAFYSSFYCSFNCLYCAHYNMELCAQLALALERDTVHACSGGRVCFLSRGRVLTLHLLRSSALLALTAGPIQPMLCAYRQELINNPFKPSWMSSDI